jgi:hypothetical protein
MSLGEFQQALAALVGESTAASASRPSSMASCVDMDDATVDASDTASSQQQHSDDCDDGMLAQAVSALLNRVVPEMRVALEPLWRQRRSVLDFIAEAVALKVSSRLGFELTLDEFRSGVAAVVARVDAGETADAAAYYEITALSAQLGPEMCAVVRRTIDGMVNLSELSAAIETLERPMVNVASPQYHPSCVATLLDGEARLGYLPYFDDFQPEVSSRVRHILVDWIVDVTARYRFCDETLHLAIALFDRYLAVKPVARGDVQLVGIAALFLATKYEEIYPPDVHDLVAMAAHTYTKEDILHTERQIFMKLAFRVTIPSSFAFAQAVMAEQDPMPTPLQRHMVAFLLEAALHTHVYGQLRPSLTACAAVFIARVWCAIPTPTPSQEVLHAVQQVFNAVMKVLRLTARCPAQRNKYASSKYERVSLLPLPVSQLEAAVGLRLVDPAADTLQQQHPPQPEPQLPGLGHSSPIDAPLFGCPPSSHHLGSQMPPSTYRPSSYGGAPQLGAHHSNGAAPSSMMHHHHQHLSHANGSRQPSLGGRAPSRQQPTRPM